MNRSRLAHRCCLIALLLSLIACASKLGDHAKAGRIMDSYASALRWGQIEQAWQFVDPMLRQTQPLSDFDLERFKQVQITGYQVKSQIDLPDGAIEQRVEIRLINKHTQIERTLIDQQRWQWDPTGENFWLMSGLPDLSKH